MLFQGGEGSDDGANLSVQLQAIRLLRILLPQWRRSTDERIQLLNQLIDLIVRCVLTMRNDRVLQMTHTHDQRLSTGSWRLTAAHSLTHIS